jgi:hypothetical protein
MFDYLRGLVARNYASARNDCATGVNMSNFSNHLSVGGA